MRESIEMLQKLREIIDRARVPRIKAPGGLLREPQRTISTGQPKERSTGRPNLSRRFSDDVVSRRA